MFFCTLNIRMKKLQALLNIYGGIKNGHRDGQFNLLHNPISHDRRNEWQIVIRLWKNGDWRVMASAVGGTIEDAASAAVDDYYDRLRREGF